MATAAATRDAVETSLDHGGRGSLRSRGAFGRGGGGGGGGSSFGGGYGDVGVGGRGGLYAAAPLLSERAASKAGRGGGGGGLESAGSDTASAASDINYMHESLRQYHCAEQDEGEDDEEGVSERERHAAIAIDWPFLIWRYRPISSCVVRRYSPDRNIQSRTPSKYR